MTPAPTSWRGLKRAGQPTVFTIPPTAPFVDVLAAGLKADAGDDPLALARMTILLPTRRSCRALREAFLRLGNGAPVLLPRLVPLNDLDADEALLTSFAAPAEAADLPPSIAPLRRQLLLARLILARDGASHDQAVALAGELARLLDELQTENVPFERLRGLVPDDYARHWQDTLSFLDIVTRHWPGILATEDAVDPVAHRNLVFAAQARAWQERAGALPGPVIAAGSTGSIPATAALLEVVARLPEGCVVLPGLDRTLDDGAWADVAETHPQFGLKSLLEKLGVTRDAVRLWPGCDDDRSDGRVRLASEIMRPASSTERWRDLNLPAGAAAHLSLIVAPTPREEAAAIAMAMREALETPEATCALVTPDRDLAVRVASELERWDITVDDSAGRDLDLLPAGVFLRLLAEMAAGGAAPLALLSVCKHPLAAAGLDPARFRELTRQAETALLRGPRPAPGLETLRRMCADVRGGRRLETWLDALDRTCGSFLALMSGGAVPVAQLLSAHMQCAERLASSDESAGPLRLWAGEDGEAAAIFIAELAQACDALPPVAPAAYPALFAALLKGRVVRPRFGRHPRLAILGPLEARLQRFDTVILGGLNEGVWPAEPTPDPWLSRPMRRQCGLPAPEHRIGLAAHDVAEALCGPRVILSRAEKSEGAPSVPSRWLMRLDQVLAAAGLAAPKTGPWLAYANLVTRPRVIKAWPAPAPCPPLDARPSQLSVTRVEEWMRDPYAIYARRILRLKALEPIDADVSAAEYGTLIHQALHQFVRDAGPLTQERLMAIGEALFARAVISPAVRVFWWPRFVRIAAWFVAAERERRTHVSRSLTEITGRTLLKGARDFELTATADRIDVLKDNTIAIIDYKTGVPPSDKEVLAGYAPQLPLEAVIALAGGFPDIAPSGIGEMTFWHLHGRDDGATTRQIAAPLGEVAARARAGLLDLIAAYADPATPYPARPHPKYAPRYSDYEHLARVKEWASASGGDDA